MSVPRCRRCPASWAASPPSGFRASSPSCCSASAPRRGLEVLVDTGLADVVLPELPALRMAADEHGQHKDVYAHTLQVLDQAIDLETEGPDLVLRWAAVLHDVGKPATRRFEPGGRVTFHHHEAVGAKLARKRLQALRYPTQLVDEVAQLVFLHLRFYGYGRGEWTDSAVRRYVVDAGPAARSAAQARSVGLHDP